MSVALIVSYCGLHYPSLALTNNNCTFMKQEPAVLHLDYEPETCIEQNNHTGSIMAWNGRSPTYFEHRVRPNYE